MKKIVLAVSAMTMLLAGCSSISQADFNALRAEVAEAKEASQKAYQAAQQANLNAQDAKAMSLRTDEKLNRVFRKAQMK